MAVSHFQTFLAAYAAVEEPERRLGEEQVLSPPLDLGYDATPLNGVTFAAMGVDGVHWAALMRDGQVRDDSPVVYVSPMDSDDVTVIAESLISLLAFGCRVTPDRMLEVFEQERSDGDRLVPFLREHFRSEDLLHDERVGPLQERFRHLIERRFV